MRDKPKPMRIFPILLITLPLIASACSSVPTFVVENYSLSLVVSDPDASLRQLRTMAAAMGGSIDDSSVSFSAYEVPDGTVAQATLTMRIPLYRLQHALARMKDGAMEVGYFNVSRENFTPEYELLVARRAELERSRDELVTLIEETSTVSQDALLANDLLHRIDSELDPILSRIRFLEQEAALPTISVELMPIEVRRLTAPVP